MLIFFFSATHWNLTFTWKSALGNLGDPYWKASSWGSMLNFRSYIKLRVSLKSGSFTLGSIGLRTKARFRERWRYWKRGEQQTLQTHLLTKEIFRTFSELLSSNTLFIIYLLFICLFINIYIYIYINYIFYFYFFSGEGIPGLLFNLSSQMCVCTLYHFVFFGALGLNEVHYLSSYNNAFRTMDFRKLHERFS